MSRSSQRGSPKDRDSSRSPHRPTRDTRCPRRQEVQANAPNPPLQGSRKATTQAKHVVPQEDGPQRPRAHRSKRGTRQDPAPRKTTAQAGPTVAGQNASRSTGLKPACERCAVKHWAARDIAPPSTTGTNHKTHNRGILHKLEGRGPWPVLMMHVGDALRSKSLIGTNGPKPPLGIGSSTTHTDDQAVMPPSTTKVWPVM